MFTQILHHPYRKIAGALDVSGWNHHGLARDVDSAADGASTGSGALEFRLPSSRVSLPGGPVFATLHALKIEVVALIGALGQRRNLVEGHGSFAFFIHPDGSLLGTALGRLASGGPLDWYGADSVNTPVGGPKTVPIGRWVKLTYLHDGFASIRLFIDDVLVAQNTALASSIRPVGPRGIHVGNWPDADAYTFYGAIDDVRIWKWEPDYGYLQFFCRDRAQCATWRDVYASLGAWSRGPEGRRRVQALYRCLGNLQLDLVRTVRRQDAATLAAIRTLSERYHRAWCAGDIDGRDMRQVLEDWFRALREILGDGVLDGYVRRMVACFEQHGLRDGLVPKVDFTCDTAFPGFIEAVARTFRLEQADGSQSR